MPLVGTVDCAIWLTLRSILLDSALYGHVPQNAGLTRPIPSLHRPHARQSGVPAPSSPASARQRLADTVMKAWR